MVQADRLCEGQKGKLGEKERYLHGRRPYGYALEDEASYQPLALSVPRLCALGQDAFDDGPAAVN